MELPGESTLEEMLHFAREVAREAGTLVLEGFRKHPRMQKKGVVDLVTEFDLRSEALIRAAIEARYPEHRFVGEEAALPATSASGSESEDCWYVDPIDGTTNYVHGHPFFAVSIALYRGETPLVAVIEAPALQLSWWARRGGGSFRQGEAAAVSGTTLLSESLGATGFPYDKWTNPDNNTREFAHAIKQVRGIRRCGAASLDLAMVADGTFDFYWEKRLKPWDCAAGALLVEEAGGKITHISGSPFGLQTSDLLASNTAMHAPVLALLREAQA